MGKSYNQLDDRLVDFIQRQHIFFVGTAPTSVDGHLNISPKGLDTFRILGPKTIAYLDLVGSGIETVAHLRQNSRITIMFCAFEGAPMILRIHGRGKVIEPGDAEWEDLVRVFPPRPGMRSIIILEADRITDSCGFGVPEYDFRGDRDQLTSYACRKGPSGLERYKAEKNRRSIDGLDGLRKLSETE